MKIHNTNNNIYFLFNDYFQKYVFKEGLFLSIPERLHYFKYLTANDLVCWSVVLINTHNIFERIHSKLTDKQIWESNLFLWYLYLLFCLDVQYMPI